jgi:DNA-directed RNA polymerase specialized sigma24 family protein
MSEIGQLLERQLPALRRYARSLTHDVGHADDLARSRANLRAMTDWGHSQAA